MWLVIHDLISMSVNKRGVLVSGTAPPRAMVLNGRCLSRVSTANKHMAFMMTSSNGNIFRVTGPLCGEFTGHRWIPRTKASDAELWCFLWSAPWINAWANKGWWFEPPSRSLWCHCNEVKDLVHITLKRSISDNANVKCTRLWWNNSHSSYCTY